MPTHIAFSDEGPSVAVAALGFGTLSMQFRKTGARQSQKVSRGAH
jgi:hypothetical protein